jgi:hypothetical protein
MTPVIRRQGDGPGGQRDLARYPRSKGAAMVLP